MAGRKIKSNTLIVYILVTVAIVVLVMWLTDSRSFNGLHRNHIVVSSWNWAHILISLAIGFVLGIVFSRRK